MSRKSTYSEEKAYEICEIIATTTKGLRAISVMEGMPDMSTIVRWLQKNDSFKSKYAEAKQWQQDLEVEEMKEISDGGDADDIVKVNRDKLRVHARMWLSSKLAPKKYGDKIEVENTGTLTVKSVSFE
jgi:hypothetical protein